MNVTSLPFEVDFSSTMAVEPAATSGVGMTIFIAVITVLYFSAGIFEFLCCVLFIYHLFLKTPYFYTGFFYVLIIGHIVDLIGFVFSTLTWYGVQEGIIVVISNLMLWYSSLLIGPWNTLLALNRFTAVLYWKNHSNIWTGLPLIGILCLFLLYPLMVNGYILNEFYCVTNPNEKICEKISKHIRFVELLSNGVNIIITALLGFLTALASRFNLITLTAETKKFEKHLLIQSILSTVFFIGSLVFIFGINNYDNESELEELSLGQMILIGIEQCYYTYFHMSATILLFFMSKTVRQSFTSFYNFKRCFVGKKIINKVSTTTSTLPVIQRKMTITAMVLKQSYTKSTSVPEENESVQQSTLLTELPNEILSKIFQHVLLADLFKLEQVDKNLRKAVLGVVWPQKNTLRSDTITHYFEKSSVYRNNNSRMIPSKINTKFIKAVFARTNIQRLYLSSYKAVK